MTQQINDGGPAFPRDHRNDGHNGMTLRDWFAGQALAAIIDDSCPDETATSAYKLADAMLKAREVTK